MPIIELSQALLQEVTSIRHQLHEQPELSGNEFLTTQLLKEKLLAHSIKVLDAPIKTGVIAEIGDKEKGPTIALRADIDALPINEATTLSFKSKNPGVMHACGHDFHAASLLGAAIVLKQIESQLAGRIRLIFQPAEEINQGAKEVIQAGALEDVTAIIGYHNKPDLPIGTIGVKAGPLMAAVDQFKVTITGVGTHAAAPHNGSDPIVTASQIISSLQAIISRHLSPLSAAVLSVTHIEGGNTWNVIPEDVMFEGTIRTFSSKDQEKIKHLFSETIEHYSKVYHQSSQIAWIPSPPAVNNNAALTQLIAQTSQKFATIVDPGVTLGGEDFANYQLAIPGFFAFIGTGKPFEWHHPAFEVDDAALPTAIHYYVENARSLLTAFGSDDDKNLVSSLHNK